MKTDISKMLQQAVEVHGYTLDANGNKVPAQKARTEFLTALAQAFEQAKFLGHPAFTVYLNCTRLSLVQETLSDGSKVMNIHLGS